MGKQEDALDDLCVHSDFSLPSSLLSSFPPYLIQDREEGTEARSYSTPENITMGAVRTGTEGGMEGGREGG